MDNFMSWSYVASFIGVTFCTQMLVEFTKEMRYVKNVPTRYLSAIVAFILILCSTLVMATFKFIDIPLYILNSILVCYTANGGYQFNYRKVKIADLDEVDNKIENIKEENKR